MLFKVGNTVYNPDETPCALVFANDEERLNVIKVLQAMDEKPGEVRWFACINDKMGIDKFMEWSVLTPEEDSLLKIYFRNRAHL